LEALNARERKKRIGSIGAGERSSQATKATRKAAPAMIAPNTVGEVQPSSAPRTMP
jgi:hypothetical protein